MQLVMGQVYPRSRASLDIRQFQHAHFDPEGLHVKNDGHDEHKSLLLGATEA